MIEKEADRKNYRPTVLVQSLASGYQDHTQLGSVARGHIVALTEKHGCPVAVSTRFGLNMIVRECTHSLSHFTLSTYYPGFVYPLLQSAAGLVYLAFSSESERQLTRSALAQSGEADHNALSFTSEATLNDVRRQGFATRGRNRFTVPEGKNSGIAAPIFHNGHLCGTLALIFLASSVRMDKAVELYSQDVVDAAQAIGADLDNLQSLPTRISA
jgi:IclR family mhp operon transcriptional activator